MKMFLFSVLCLLSASTYAWQGEDAYGPGIHSDATGRPYTSQSDDGQAAQGHVNIDAYGPGIHQDEYGRAVHENP